MSLLVSVLLGAFGSDIGCMPWSVLQTRLGHGASRASGRFVEFIMMYSFKRT